MTRNFLAIACSLPMLLLAVSCGGGRNVTIASWQDNIEQYVRTHGKGDPTVLRDLTLSDSRPGYSMIGSDQPAQSSDANGLLLGHHSIGGRSWFIYIVGLVQKQEIEEIRLAALATDGGKFQWKLGGNDPQALRQYKAHNEQIWRQRFPDRKSPPSAYRRFPQVQDHFTLSVAQAQITVTHPPSGAQWELNLPTAKRPQH